MNKNPFLKLFPREESKESNELSEVLSQTSSQNLRYGFQTSFQREEFPRGISEEIIRLLSGKKGDPEFLLKFRLKAFKLWKTFRFPTWSNLSIEAINFQDIKYYSVPKKKKQVDSLDEIDPEILETFEKLGISLNEQKKLLNVAVDAVLDSSSVTTTYKEKLASHGVIFCSISEAIRDYPSLVEKFLGKIVAPGDNYFAALNSAVFSDGSFCYIPKNTRCPLELSTYFRINDIEAGQFERTLVIAEKNSEVSYLEGCTAPSYSKNQLHAAIVELVAFENATITYSTVQNWYSGDSTGKGGIYNFVTKRGLCSGKKARISWTQVETGSAITWKYPSCVLLGQESKGEFSSVAVTNHFQQADTGSKILHLGKDTKSKILSKGISAGNSRNTYRGLVKVSPSAFFSRNFSQCDSFLVGSASLASTYPYLDFSNSSSLLEHEATISKMSDEQLFYLGQRGIPEEEAKSLILTGFCKEILTMLPMEFALEADKLLALKLEGSIG